MGQAIAHGQPSHVVTEDGTVILEGPDGVAVTMTAEAAEETARRILAVVSQIRSDAAGEAHP